MRFEVTFLLRRVVWLVLGCLLACTSACRAKEMKYQALLVWATNAEKSPNPAHKPLDPALRKLLTPFKWSNYFLVKSEDFSLSEQRSAEVTLSDKCKISVKDIDGKKTEVSLIGKGQPTLKGIFSLPKGEAVALSGNAPGETGWLVVLRRVE